jgi:hypothetical protein
VTHRALVRERLRQTLPGSGPAVFSQDQEFLDSATEFFRTLERLWDGLQRQQTLTSIRHLPQVRRLFLASAVEWALDLYYEVREAENVDAGEESFWRVVGRAWDGDRPVDYEVRSATFDYGDERTSELSLIEALSKAYTGAIAGLIGWTDLDPEAGPI